MNVSTNLANIQSRLLFFSNIKAVLSSFLELLRSF